MCTLIFTKPTCASFLVSAPSIVCESGLSCLFHAGKKYALEKIINFFFIENQKNISIIYWCNVSFVSQYIITFASAENTDVPSGSLRDIVCLFIIAAEVTLVPSLEPSV